jgi:hypothetical protein
MDARRFEPGMSSPSADGCQSIGARRSSKRLDARSFHLRKMVQMSAPPPTQPAMTPSVVMAPLERLLLLSEAADLGAGVTVGVAAGTWLVMVTARPPASLVTRTTGDCWLGGGLEAAAGAGVVDEGGGAEEDELVVEEATEDEVVEEAVDEAVDEALEAEDEVVDEATEAVDDSVLDAEGVEAATEDAVLEAAGVLEGFERVAVAEPADAELLEAVSSSPAL